MNNNVYFNLEYKYATYSQKFRGLRRLELIQPKAAKFK